MEILDTASRRVTSAGKKATIQELPVTEVIENAFQTRRKHQRNGQGSPADCSKALPIGLLQLHWAAANRYAFTREAVLKPDVYISNTLSVPFSV